MNQYGLFALISFLFIICSIPAIISLKKSVLTQFKKNFLIAIIIQIDLLAIVLICLFAGGNQTNALRAIIAFFGLAIGGILNLLGFKSAMQILFGIVFLIVMNSLLIGWVFKKMGKLKSLICKTCGDKTNINWGDAHIVLCEKCQFEPDQTAQNSALNKHQ